MSLLALEGVRKSFGKNVVLQDIDLTVERGQCVVLIGASGSGKSTLLRCVNLLEVVDDGRITLDGDDITDPRIDADAVRARMGVVFQAYNLFPHLSVIDRVGLRDRAGARPDDLSGGQQQRVAIARALVNDPTLMLLDEVTSALDPELVGEVLDLLRSLTQEGMTMILNTHEMGFARQVADTVCFLDGGVIHEQGPPEQVLGDPREERTRQFLSRVHA